MDWLHAGRSLNDVTNARTKHITSLINKEVKTLYFKDFYYRNILLENIKEAKPLVQQGKITQDILDRIIDIDPSSTDINKKKFVGWMARQWVNNQVSDFDELRNTVEEWYSFNSKQKTKHKQIYGYKTFAELKNDVDHLNQSGGGISAADLENDYEVVRDDEQLLVCVPHTHEASRKLGLSHFAFRNCVGGGRDSAWCTTYKAPNHFNDYYYKNNVTFYYVKVRSEELKNRLESSGYGSEYLVTAIAILDEETSYKASQRGLPNMDAYDGLDRQFNGQKLTNYLQIIGLI